MTNKSLIRQADLQRMAKIARDFGVCVEYDIDGVTVRIRPEPAPDGETIKYDPSVDYDPVEQLLEVGGPSSHRVQQHRRLLSARPLSQLEKKALQAFSHLGVGVPDEKAELCGIGAARRLEIRGYLEIRKRQDRPGRVESFVLTEAGYEAWRSLNDRPDRPRSAEDPG